MTKDEIKDTVERLLGEIAPEVDFSRIRPDLSLREQIDLDSMDYLNFAIALSKELAPKLVMPITQSWRH